SDWSSDVCSSDLEGERPPDLNKEQLNLRRAVAQTRHLERLVNDMADTTDAAEGKFHLNRQQMRLADILQLIVADERLIAEQHEIRLDLPSADPLEMEGDPQKMSRALGNIIDNALKFSPED